MTYVGYRLERHNEHMAAVRAVQRSHQLSALTAALNELVEPKSEPHLQYEVR